MSSMNCGILSIWAKFFCRPDTSGKIDTSNPLPLFLYIIRSFRSFRSGAVLAKTPPSSGAVSVTAAHMGQGDDPIVKGPVPDKEVKASLRVGRQLLADAPEAVKLIQFMGTDLPMWVPDDAFRFLQELLPAMFDSVALFFPLLLTARLLLGLAASFQKFSVTLRIPAYVIPIAGEHLRG